MRLVARALARADDLEAGSARPIDMLADQRRLIAPGERINNAGGFRAARKQGARDRIGFDIDHDDVLAVGDRLERMTNAGAGHAGCLDDDFDLRIGDERFGVVGDERRALLVCIGKRRAA